MNLQGQHQVTPTEHSVRAVLTGIRAKSSLLVTHRSFHTLAYNITAIWSPDGTAPDIQGVILESTWGRAASKRSESCFLLSKQDRPRINHLSLSPSRCLRPLAFLDWTLTPREHLLLQGLPPRLSYITGSPGLSMTSTQCSTKRASSTKRR